MFGQEITRRVRTFVRKFFFYGSVNPLKGLLRKNERGYRLKPNNFKY